MCASGLVWRVVGSFWTGAALLRVIQWYYDLWYNRGVARTVQARLDEHSEQDLAVLRNEGHTDSEAIRLALHESAKLRRRKSALRLEAEAAAADPDDLAEALRVRAEMDAIAAVWEGAG